MIKNKNGTPYRLNRPNKLAINQKKLDKNKLILHNCHWDDDFCDSVRTKVVPMKSDFSNKVNSVEKKEIKPIVEDPVFEVPEIEEPKAERNESIPLDYSVLFHCLPAVWKNYKDELYDQEYTKLTYSEKIIFQAVIIESSDLKLYFWTTDPENQLQNGSIVYPFKYENGIPYDEYRWWKISNKTEKTGGYIFESAPSDKHPDFSD